jgi:hypothetical protein
MEEISRILYWSKNHKCNHLLNWRLLSLHYVLVYFSTVGSRFLSKHCTSHFSFLTSFLLDLYLCFANQKRSYLASF